MKKELSVNWGARKWAMRAFTGIPTIGAMTGKGGVSSLLSFPFFFSLTVLLSGFLHPFLLTLFNGPP